MNSLSQAGLIILTPALQRLQSLTALDLSCNGINFAGDNGDACIFMIQAVFRAMTHLVRLDISSNLVRGHLRSILSGILQPLHCLRLSGCGLTASDIQYMAHSHHIKGLVELDLSENILSGSGRSVADLALLLNNVGDTLMTLDLEDTKLEQSDMTHLLKLAPHCLRKLKYWNLAKLDFLHCDLHQPSFITHMSNLVALPNLRTVQFSYPTELYVSIELNEVEEEFKALYAFHLRLLVNNLSACAGREKLRLSLS
jgi:hypothetical protein